MSRSLWILTLFFFGLPGAATSDRQFPFVLLIKHRNEPNYKSRTRCQDSYQRIKGTSDKIWGLVVKSKENLVISSLSGGCPTTVPFMLSLDSCLYHRFVGAVYYRSDRTIPLCRLHHPTNNHASWKFNQRVATTRLPGYRNTEPLKVASWKGSIKKKKRNDIKDKPAMTVSSNSLSFFDLFMTLLLTGTCFSKTFVRRASSLSFSTY